MMDSYCSNWRFENSEMDEPGNGTVHVILLCMVRSTLGSALHIFHLAQTACYINTVLWLFPWAENGICAFHRH